MERLKVLLQEHKVAIILAVLASMIIAFPQVYFRVDHASDGVYQGIELLPDSPWSPRVREVQDGNIGFGNMYYRDGKDDAYLFQPAGSFVVGSLGIIFSLDINNTLLFSRVLFSFLVVILLYSFVFLISRDKIASLASVAVIFFADAALTYSGMTQLLQGISPVNFLDIGKPVNHAMIFIPLFAFLISFWMYYERGDLKYGVLSALFLGLNFYNYFYTWTFLYAFGGLLGLMFLAQRRWVEVRRIVLVFTSAVLIGIPFAFNLYQARQYDSYPEVSIRFGVVESHEPMFIGFVSLFAILIFLLGFPRQDSKRFFFGLALVLAPLITINQQIITGTLLQVGHYHWYFHKPFAVIFTFIVFFYTLSKIPILSRYRLLAGLAICTVSIAIGMFIQVSSYHNGKVDGGQMAIERQEYGPAMKWLNDNAEPESVVFANSEASHLVVIYTPLNVVYHWSAMYTLAATDERVFDALFSFYRLRGVGESDAPTVFFAERDNISSGMYGVYYRDLLGSYENIPVEVLDKLTQRYIETLDIPRAVWLQDLFNKYKVEYIIWNQSTDPSWNLGQYNFLSEEFRFGDIKVYEFNQ